MPDLAPFYTQVQAHYDLSDDFFALFLDPSRTYSCAYFERDDMTLAEAQRAKVDLALGKLDLQPGMTLLDVGCGWGSALLRAVETYDVDVIGLTLSNNQHEYVRKQFAALSGNRSAEVRLQGWEEFDGTADRIVSIGAFEHFRRERYDAFFRRCRRVLPPDGRMLLHTITGEHRHELHDKGLPIDHDYLVFAKFIREEIFPGGQLPEPTWVTDSAEAAGFTVDRIHPLRLHYARTLDLWAAALAAHRDEAIRIASVEQYDRYIRYLTGCANWFRDGYTDVMQFSLSLQTA